jgi:hypothetical protein
MVRRGKERGKKRRVGGRHVPSSHSPGGNRPTWQLKYSKIR